jgi:Tol biopolymer transport system component
LGAKSPLCVRSMETGEERELYVQLRLFNPHHYSPDGRFVIVQGVDNDGQNGLFQIDVETGLATILVKCAADTRIRWATWSPDGDKLFYKYMVTSEEPTRLMQYDLETRQEQELFRENSWPTCPALSPDGQWLAFQTLDQEKMNRSLNIMPADSGELREIVGLEGGEYISSIAWMPDGKSILYVKSTLDGPKQRELWQVSTEGGSPRNVGLTMDGMAFLNVHPDGRQIAFSAYKLRTEIWVMENFLPDELSQR